MNTAERLINDNDNLKYRYVRMPKKLGGLICNDQVFINKSANYVDQNEWLAEEIGHYQTSVGDIIDQSEAECRKQELIARQRAYTLLITLDGLLDCYKNGSDTPNELADYFDVSVDFLYKAIDTYRIKNGLIFDYEGYTYDLRNGLNIYHKK